MLPFILASIAAGSPEVITLSGSSGSPRLAAHIVTDPGAASAGWRFNSDGTVDRNQGGYSQFEAGVEWANTAPNASTDYWIRATLDSGSNPSSGTMNTWLQLSSNRTWEWARGSVGVLTGVLQIEIASDSGGSNIVATGYYSGNAEVES